MIPKLAANVERMIFQILHIWTSRKNTTSLKTLREKRTGELKETIGNLQRENCELLEQINEEAQVEKIKKIREMKTLCTI